MQLGAQTYTIRTYTQSERDLARALKKVRAIGYQTSLLVDRTGALLTPELIAELRVSVIV